jgi:hypothetical protein
LINEGTVEKNKKELAPAAVDDRRVNESVMKPNNNVVGPIRRIIENWA